MVLKTNIYQNNICVIRHLHCDKTRPICLLLVALTYGHKAVRLADKNLVVFDNITSNVSILVLSGLLAVITCFLYQSSFIASFCNE